MTYSSAALGRTCCCFPFLCSFDVCPCYLDGVYRKRGKSEWSGRASEWVEHECEDVVGNDFV